VSDGRDLLRRESSEGAGADLLRLESSDGAEAHLPDELERESLPALRQGRTKLDTKRPSGSHMEPMRGDAVDHGCARALPRSTLGGGAYRAPSMST